MSALEPVPEQAVASTPPDAARIRELMLANLFAVFSERVRDGRIAVLHTLLDHRSEVHP